MVIKRSAAQNAVESEKKSRFKTDGMNEKSVIDEVAMTVNCFWYRMSYLAVDQAV